MSHIDTMLSRRNFLVATLSAAGGLAIGVSIPGFASAAPLVSGAPWNNDQAAAAGEVNAWIVIDPDDTVTIQIGRASCRYGP